MSGPTLAADRGAGADRGARTSSSATWAARPFDSSRRLRDHQVIVHAGNRASITIPSAYPRSTCGRSAPAAGSIASVDAGGLAPCRAAEQAGARPGPACYGLGGTAATITDANIVLGILDPGYFLGGRMGARPRGSGARGPAHRRPARVGLERRRTRSTPQQPQHGDGRSRRITIREGINPRDSYFVCGAAAHRLPHRRDGRHPRPQALHDPALRPPDCRRSAA